MRRSVLVLAGCSSLLIRCSSSTNDTSHGGGVDSGNSSETDGSGSGAGGKGGASVGGKGGGAGFGGRGGESSGGTGNAGASGNGGATPSDGGSVDAATGNGGTNTDSGSSIHDAAALDSTTGVDAGGPADAGGVPPIAHFGQVRLVNLASDSVPMDFCMKLTSQGSYTDGPVLRAGGITTGIPFQSESQYVDLAVNHVDVFDFLLVAASSASCGVPVLGAFGSVTFGADTSVTIAVFQNQFPSSGNYSAGLFFDDDHPTAHTGNVNFLYAANYLQPTADVHASRPSVADELWFSNVLGGSPTLFHGTVPSTYGFRATKTGTQTDIAQKSGVVVAADLPLNLLLYPSSATTESLVTCPARPGSAVVACAP